MAITTPAGIVAALATNSSRIIIDKQSLANQTATRVCSFWRALGQPTQASIPTTTAAICTSATLGAFPFTNQTDPVKSYLGWFWAQGTNSGQTLEMHDRIAHTGGLVLNVTTSQTLGAAIDVLTLGVVAARRGNANYSDLQWWFEVYTDGGGTASNATVNVTYNDGTTGNLSVQAVGGTLRAGNMLPLNPLIPALTGKWIRGINSVINSASTGTAGNFGITVTRPITTLPLDLANRATVADWASLGFPEVPNDACLMPTVVPSTNSSGALRGGGKIAHG